MSSSEEDDFDQFLIKKNNIIKKKFKGTKRNYQNYLVSRKSIIKTFRRSKGKELKTIFFIIFFFLLTIFYGILTMSDLFQLYPKIITFSNYTFNVNIYLSKIISQICKLF